MSNISRISPLFRRYPASQLTRISFLRTNNPFHSIPSSLATPNEVWDPFHESAVLTNPLDIVDNALNSLGVARPLRTDSLRCGIRMDMIETESGFEVHADLPGIPKENIDVNIHDNRLTLTATSDEVTEDSKDTYYRRERFFGKTQRTVTLPSNADVRKAEAKFENGVLTMKFPKLEGEAGGIKLRIE